MQDTEVRRPGDPVLRTVEHDLDDDETERAGDTAEHHPLGPRHDGNDDRREHTGDRVDRHSDPATDDHGPRQASHDR